MADKYILFYSQYCQHSQDFIVALQKTGYHDKFVKICVDDKKYKIPPSITAVPSIIIPEYNEPLQAADTFAWINSIIEKKSQTDTIEAYHPTVMSGFSDSYSSIEDGGEATPMSHSFDFIHDAFKINTPTDMDEDPRKANSSNSKQNDMEQSYERLMQQRDMEVQQDRKRI